MNDYISKLQNKIDDLHDLMDYIKSLENRVKNDTSFQNVEFFTVDMQDDVQTQSKLYRPKKVYIKNDIHCEKCSDGLIKQDNDFSNEFELCECALDSVVYETDEISVYSMICHDDEIWYVTYDDGNEILINDNYVVSECNDKFDKHLNLYYSNKDACDRLCEVLNGK